MEFRVCSSAWALTAWAVRGYGLFVDLDMALGSWLCLGRSGFPPVLVAVVVGMPVAWRGVEVVVGDFLRRLFGADCWALVGIRSEARRYLWDRRGGILVVAARPL